MKENDFTEKQNREIFTACCIIFVSYLPHPKSYLGEWKLEDICKLISDHNWEQLLKSESWIESLTKVAVELPTKALEPTSDALKVIMEHFDEMNPILHEATKIRNFGSAKRGYKFSFHDLPLHTQFCFFEDEYQDEPAGRYKNHFAKDNDTDAHCFIGDTKRNKIKVEPQTIVVYIPVGGP